jgi:hypothetical protein
VDPLMRMLALRSLLVALPFLAAAPSCNGGGESSGPYTSIPEESAERTLAKELCRLMLERCDCATPQSVFDSIGECTDAFADQLDMDFAEAKAAGLAYHPECMAEHVNFWVDTVGCTTQSELTQQVITELSNPPCKVYSGPGKLGDACKPYYQALGDDCDVGLQCFNTCMDVVELVDKAEGEPCTLQTDRCEAGTACLASADDPTGTATCERLPGEGQPCSVGCDVGLTCDSTADGTDRVCKAPPREGEPCGSLPYECAEGLYCGASICAITLPEGAPCFGDDEACGVGYVCDEPPGDDGGEDVCMLESAFVCF